MDGKFDENKPLRSIFSVFVTPHWGLFILGSVGLLLGQMLSQLPAFVFGVALDAILLESGSYSLPLVPDAIIPEENMEQLWFTVGLLAAAYVGKEFINWISHLSLILVEYRSLHELRMATYDALTGIELIDYHDRQTGDLIGTLDDDITNIGSAFTGIKNGLMWGGQVVTAFAFMFNLQWQLAVALLVMPLGFAVISRTYANLLKPRYERVRERVADINTAIDETVSGITTVKAYTREESERDRTKTDSQAYLDDKWSTIRLRLMYDALSWSFSSVMFVGLFLVAAFWVYFGPPLFFSGELTAGALLTFLMYTNSFMEPVRNFAIKVVDRFESAVASSKRIRDVFELGHTDPKRGDQQLDMCSGHVEYDGVGYSYTKSDGPTLESIDIEAEPGDFVGIVGPTGSGKSTLVKLLFRLYDADHGSLRVDGTDVREIDPISLRRQLGYVSQEPFLFSGTIRENIAYALDHIDEDGVIEAAQLAGVEEFVDDLPDGYDTKVGEQGVKLSGGQRQRIAIARAIVRDPAVLVLDEATSHVDTDTERQIQESIQALSDELTIFAIAHRLSTVQSADEIVVLEDGRVTERGTHDTLCSKDGLYATLWNVHVGADGVEQNSITDSQETVQGGDI